MTKLAGSGWFSCPRSIFGPGRTVYEIVVEAYLRRRAGTDGSPAWPSYNTIAKECGMSRSQAKMTVRALEAQGRIRRQERRDRKGQTSNIFVLVELPEDTPGQVVTGGGSGGARSPGQEVPGPRAGGDPEVDPLNERPLKITASAPNGQSRPAPVQFDGQDFHVPEPLLTSWKDAYPAINVQREIRAAAAWAHANPKNRKKNWAAFLVRWLSKAQERAPRVKPNARETAAQIEGWIGQEWTPPGRDEPQTPEVAAPHRDEIRKQLGLRASR